MSQSPSVCPIDKSRQAASSRCLGACCYVNRLDWELPRNLLDKSDDQLLVSRLEAQKDYEFH